MIVNVRGGMGMQHLEALVGIAIAIEKGEEVEAIQINVGGDVVDTVRANYLSATGYFNVPVRVVDGVEKQRAWDNLGTLLVNYEKVMVSKYMRMNVFSSSELCYLHIRGKDRQTTSVKTYQDIIPQAVHAWEMTPILMGDDLDLALKVQKGFEHWTRLDFHGNPLHDWFKFQTAEQVVGPFSTFTFAAFLFHPFFKLKVMGPELNDGPVKINSGYYKMIEDFSRKMKNVKLFRDIRDF